MHPLEEGSKEFLRLCAGQHIVDCSGITLLQFHESTNMVHQCMYKAIVEHLPTSEFVQVLLAIQKLHKSLMSFEAIDFGKEPDKVSRHCEEQDSCPKACAIGSAFSNQDWQSDDFVYLWRRVEEWIYRIKDHLHGNKAEQ